MSERPNPQAKDLRLIVEAPLKRAKLECASAYFLYQPEGFSLKRLDR